MTLIPMNQLIYEEKLACCKALNAKYKSTMPVKLLVEWDEVRLKLFPNAKKMMVEV